jgi:hypothetical protein
VDVILFAHELTLIELLGNDAGLAASVRAAEEAFSTAAPPLPVAAAPGATAPAAPGRPSADDEQFSLRELAEAKVELERLLCHIHDYESHYFQAIFQNMHPDQRLELLRDQRLADIVRNEIVGFFNDYALFPLVDVASRIALLKASTKMKVSEGDIAKFVAKVTGDIDAGVKARLVTIPTPATLMEATLGECDACEDFIRDSRAIDLRQQAAKAAQEEARARSDNADADRRERRLAADPPDLTDPVDHSPARIVVDVNTNSDS